MKMDFDPLRKPTEMSRESRLKAKNYYRNNFWLRHFGTLNGSEKDSITRYLLTKRSEATSKTLFFGLAPLFTWCIANEIQYSYFTLDEDLGPCKPFWNTTHTSPLIGMTFFQCLTTVLSIINLYYVYRFNFLQFELGIIDQRQHPDIKFWESDYGKQTFKEWFFCILHVPPGIYQCWTTYAEWDVTYVVFYPIQIMNIFMVVRVYLIGRYVGYNNRFATQRATTVLKLYSQRNSPLLAFKDMLQKPHLGVTFFLCAYFGGLVFFAYGVMIFERPAGHEEHGSAFLPYFRTTIWMIWTVVTTIGFGDWTCMTVMGRFVTVLCGLYGTVISAFIVSYAYSLLDMSGPEKKVASSLDYLDLKFALQKEAAILVQRWWIARKNKTLLARSRFTECLANWKDKLFEFEESKDPGLDLVDIKNQIIDLQIFIKDRTFDADSTKPSSGNNDENNNNNNKGGGANTLYAHRRIWDNYNDLSERMKSLETTVQMEMQSFRNILKGFTEQYMVINPFTTNAQDLEKSLIQPPLNISNKKKVDFIKPNTQLFDGVGSVGSIGSNGGANVSAEVTLGSNVVTETSINERRQALQQRLQTNKKNVVPAKMMWGF